MAAWTFNEPWPNAAHGSILDYRGLPKMGYFWVRDALQMRDASLEYYDPFVTADGARPLGSSAGGTMSIWADSELAVATPAWGVTLDIFYVNGSRADGDRPEIHRIPGGQLPPSRSLRLAHVRFVPPLTAVGQVLLVRLSMHAVAPPATARRGHPPLASPSSLLAQHTYAFAVVCNGSNSTSVRAPLHPLLRPPLARLSASAHRDAHSGAVTVRVTVASEGAAAHYVKLTLRMGPARPPLPFVRWSRSMFTLLPGEEDVEAVGSQALPGAELAKMACVEAWNAERVCAAIRW